MDVEKTIAFILDQQAKTEVLWQQNEERWQRNEERWKRAEQRVDKFDRSLVGIRKLILLGAKTLASSQKAAKAELREIREDIRELTAAQKRTDQKFERLVELLSRRSPNGRH
ncbi:MAG TPA: hypothetical protein VNY30_11880 [Bryobacteraceae bacterium]|jgi:hypothetical protein|nr:hypothetical protein [Bryobacteraceae bacterium]